MARLLFIVEDTFAIRGRGVVLVPGLASRDVDLIPIGSSLRLVPPDGSALAATLRGVERFPSHSIGAWPILVAGVEKADVPIGSEVWSADPPPAG